MNILDKCIEEIHRVKQTYNRSPKYLFLGYNEYYNLVDTCKSIDHRNKMNVFTGELQFMGVRVVKVSEESFCKGCLE